ncbi:class I SAM-dependent methyltransferase [Micromonospora sp. NBC_01813]|uniref:class I SAM-dependent methyltransferase n=1 Tax=Micromonospora sp. NBC_01813 TaxID=2975988 RepID=UPI002DDAA0FF|nr:class I SAM-dependent methyltransferase [Micromonospora sp. NBC_01813]WSA07692.1 class I SAM-dependent methyltransferase [Micromonospora sp. NBC_01813]
MTDQPTASGPWDRRAARYDTFGLRAERLIVGDSRAWLCEQATGRTLEVAAGTGRNFSFYPPEVTLVAIDASTGMLDVARDRAAALGRDIEIRQADATALPYADASFDAVVCTLALCSVADREGALAEMHRVLRPGGRLLLLDHYERRWRQTRPADLALRQGFVAERRRRLRLGLIERLAARRP